MKLSYIYPAVAGCILLLSSCSGQSRSSDSDTVLSSAEQPMLAPDDFDSTKVKEKKEEVDPQRPNYTAYTSNEAIELMQSLPDADKYMSGILPKMSQECLSYAMKLLNNTHDGFLIVDKETMQVALYDRYGREQLKYGIACGRNYGTKHSKGDSRTPEGFFSVQGIYDSTDWLFTDDNGKTSQVKGQFGPRFIRLLIPGTTQIGIHGTRAPGSIGLRCSHGCIRVTNDHILELVKHVTPGMPVIVSPSRRDEKVNVNEGRRIPWVSVSKGPVSRKPQTPDPKKPAVKTDSVPAAKAPKDSVPSASSAPVTVEEAPTVVPASIE